jgi:hypothetical protein
MWSRNHDEATATTEASPHPAHVLLVADRVEATAQPQHPRPRGARTRQVPRLVPSPAPEWHPTHPTATKVCPRRRRARPVLPRIEAADRHPVDGVVSIRRDLMNVNEETLHDADFDEVIVFAAPRR